MGASKAMCAQYAADYDAALAKAKECDVKADACGKMVPAALSGCKSNCQTYVQDDSALTELRRQWDKARCATETCLTSICINISAGSCKPGNSDDEGGSGKDAKKDPKAEMQKGTCTDGLIVL
ncbi:MAG TPA: hypothetical protein VHU40_15015 [Polyangia bacterium]|nr:hypothetical protein [Polyangia bacterium]